MKRSHVLLKHPMDVFRRTQEQALVAYSLASPTKVKGKKIASRLTQKKIGGFVYRDRMHEKVPRTRARN